MPLYFSIASFMRLSLWPSRLFHSAHQLRKFLKVESASDRMPEVARQGGARLRNC